MSHIPHVPALFKSKHIRRIWDESREQWWFSVVDVVSALTDSVDGGAYWRKLKQRLIAEGSELVTFCHGLKLEAPDGKMRETDCCTTEHVFRLIQSIPSPNAEPFKLWLARVGHERIEEMEDPELSIDRALVMYMKKGYSKDWINQRLKSIEVRKELTDEWEQRGVQRGKEFALLTNEITKGWSGLTVPKYKGLKALKKENLRDHMTNIELVLNMLAEATTTEISKEKKPKTFAGNKKIARQGGTIAGNTRREIEAKTGKKIVSAKNAKRLGIGEMPAHIKK